MAKSTDHNQRSDVAAKAKQKRFGFGAFGGVSHCVGGVVGLRVVWLFSWGCIQKRPRAEAGRNLDLEDFLFLPHHFQYCLFDFGSCQPVMLL